jgi:RNA polymerase sigma factor (sigma-70 family)
MEEDMYIANCQQLDQAPEFAQQHASPGALSDEELMSATAAGCSAAFDELHRRYSAYIRNFVRRKVHGDDAVEDVVQEIFIRLYKGAGRFDPARQLRQWLFAIASNEVRRHWARAGKIAKLTVSERCEDEHVEELESLLMDTGPGPYEIAVSRLLSAQLRRAIESLPEVQRTALLLRAYGGLSLQEIATATHSRVPTVSSRLHYAVEKMKRMLTEGELASI